MRNTLRSLAFAATFLAYSACAQAGATVSLFFSPVAVAQGGTSTLVIQLGEDSGVPYNSGAMTIAYPAGLVNAASPPTNTCPGSSVTANAGTGTVGISGVSNYFSSCAIYVAVTAATAGSYTVSVAPGQFGTSQGFNASGSSATLTVVAPLVVTNTLDSGAGSLRDAIISANSSCAAGLAIDFNIAGAGPKTIAPATALPAITCAQLLIDGASQPSSVANSQSLPGNNASIQMILDGSACSACDGFALNASDITVRGFAIRSFSGAGILVNGSYARILGNYIGTDPGGMSAYGNGSGVRIQSGYAVIGTGSPADSNLITGNGTGIWSQSGATVTNNQIGGRRDGTAGVANTGRGVFFNASSYTTNSVQSNVIRGNGLQGVSVDSATLARVYLGSNQIYGNGGIAFDLLDDGPTPNDETGPPYDTDVGPNQLLNYPVITSVTQSGGATTFSGYVKSVANADVTIQVFANSSASSNTEGETFLTTISGVLDSTGYMGFSYTVGGLYSNISAQMTADTCGDGCIYSSEYSPKVAATVSLSCSILVRTPSTGDAGLIGEPTVIVNPGETATLEALCQPDSYAWSTGATTSSINVPTPVAGSSTTYSVTVTKGAATGTASVTLKGAAPGTPLCTIMPSVPLPLDPTSSAPFQVNATCSPGATGFTWSPTFTYTLQYDSDSGASATYHMVSPDGGIGYHVQMTPTNGIGEGPTATRIIWVSPIKVTPTSLDFGTVPAGTLSAPQTVTIQNYSDYYNAYLNGAITGPYVFTDNCPDPLPPLASCTATIQFAPTTAGTAQTGTASVSFGFPGNPVYTVALTGDATGAPGVALSPASLTFTARTVNTTSGAQTVTLMNNGTTTLNVSSIAIAGDFAFTSACPATLAPGASCTIDVTFTPLVAGARSGTLTITDNASGSPHVVPLSGTGLSSAAPVLEMSASLVVFSPQQVGSESVAQFITARNSGNAPLSFTAAIGITGEFGIVATPAGSTPPACPMTLAPGASCRIDFVFRPAGLNLREGTLTIGTDGGSAVVRLMGTGMIPEPPQLVVPSSLDFGAQPVGVRSEGRPVALRNASPYPASIEELTATGDFSVSDTCLTIIVGETCSPMVTFQPTAIGPRAGTLTIRTLRDADPYTVSLTGIGVENRVPLIELSATHMGFGNAFIAMGVAHEVTLRNTGQAPLLIAGITVTGDFFSDGACLGNIAPGASCTMRITFLPTTAGGRNGVVQVTSNATNTPTLTVSLSGVGCFVPTPSRARFGVLLCGG